MLTQITSICKINLKSKPLYLLSVHLYLVNASKRTLSSLIGQADLVTKPVVS